MPGIKPKAYGPPVAKPAPPKAKPPPKAGRRYGKK